MKKMILLFGLVLFGLVLFAPVIVYGQEKIDVPIWSIGDKWTFSDGTTVKVVNGDEKSYTMQFLTSGGRELVYIHDKSSLNRLYFMQGNKRVPYRGNSKKLLNFPLHIGKSWKDTFQIQAQWGSSASPPYTIIETITVSEWEEIAIKAGNFKAMKLTYRQERIGEVPAEGKGWYWYSPEVKYLIKCEYEKSRYWAGFNDWELTSFELKK